LLRQAVADREQHIAAAGEVRSPELKCTACARLPPAAVGGNKRGKRPGARRQIEVAEQRDAIMGGVGNAGAGFDRLRCRHCLSFQRRGDSPVASDPCASRDSCSFPRGTPRDARIAGTPLRGPRSWIPRWSLSARKRGRERTEPSTSAAQSPPKDPPKILTPSRSGRD